jgi:hypothetical protein
MSLPASFGPSKPPSEEPIDAHNLNRNIATAKFDNSLDTRSPRRR